MTTVTPAMTRPTNIKRTWPRRPSSKNKQTSSIGGSTRQRNGPALLNTAVLRFLFAKTGNPAEVTGRSAVSDSAAAGMRTWELRSDWMNSRSALSLASSSLPSKGLLNHSIQRRDDIWKIKIAGHYEGILLEFELSLNTLRRIWFMEHRHR